MAILDSLPPQRRLLRDQVGQKHLANMADTADTAESQKTGVLVPTQRQMPKSPLNLSKEE